jgi:ATP adenylyltransferase
MNHLHAYWRMEYIEAPKSGDSPATPFSDIPKATDEKAVHLLYRGALTYLVLNRYPYNAGHLLAIPYREAADLEDLSEDEANDLTRTIIKGKQILRQALNPDGFNIGFNLGAAAGAGIPRHLHCHIVPRWSGDTNFMPVLGGTRVLPTSLDAMWERLRTFA